MDRYLGNKKKAVVNTLNKASLRSEGETGSKGVLNADSGIYDSRGKDVEDPVMKTAFVLKGTLVKAVDLDGDPDSPKHEGLTEVILPNKNGDFYGGERVWLISDKIDWPDKVRR
ncbi:MAG: hypothetical protein ACD_14C00043G0001 [uncultured bacterium]|nr:MAG: hypothetical protein ACD_14C00043G0001 [uncultured bacterium]